MSQLYICIVLLVCVCMCVCAGLWVMAAKFQMEDLNDSSSARSLLQQGLRVNGSSQHLWLEVRVHV